MAILAELVAAVAQQPGLPQAADAPDAPDAADAPVAEHISACLAGADLAADEEQLSAALHARGWAVTCSVVNDTFAILRAGLVPGLGDAGGGQHQPDAPLRPDAPLQPGAPLRHWGVGVTCGAGINCVAVAPDGREARFPALGELTGDWGGGEGLGRAALWWAVRDEDGRGPPTMLREAIAAHFGVPCVSDVGIGIHYGKISESELLGLAPVLLQTASRGDEIARNLVTRLAGEIVTMAVTMMAAAS